MEELAEKNLDYWKTLNSNTSEYESVVALGSWNEADKLDELPGDD